MRTGRTLVVLIVALLLQLGLLLLVLGVAYGVYQARDDRDRARISQLEQEVKLLCARKVVTAVTLTATAKVKVSTQRGC